MDLGTVRSGGTLPLDTNGQNEVAMEDSEILRRLVRLLSKSEEDELYAQGSPQDSSFFLIRRDSDIFSTRRTPTDFVQWLEYHTQMSEGDTNSVHLNRSRSVLRLAETAPLRISRAPKADLTETFKYFERSSSKVRAKLTRIHNAFRGTRTDNAITKAATKMSVHLESVTNFMRQQTDILTQAETGPPSQVYASNLSSSLSGLAQSARALSRALNETRGDGFLADVDDMEPLENLAQLAESESRSIKGEYPVFINWGTGTRKTQIIPVDSKANNAMKRISGIRFRQHFADLNTQFCTACDDVAIFLSDIIKSAVPVLRDRGVNENHEHLLRTGIAIMFSVVTAMMLSLSVDRGSSTLDLAVSGIWLIALASGVAAGITGIIGIFFSGSRKCDARQSSANASKWLAKGSEVLFLVAATLFSVGLCIFAFSSTQATAARVIVTIFTAIHFFGIFALSFWFLRSNRGESRNSRRQSVWSSMRGLAQLSIKPTLTGKPERVGLKDVERGLHPRASTVRSPVPPIIQITDTDQELAPATRNSSMSGNQVHTNDANFKPDSERNFDTNEGEPGSENDLTSISFSNTHTNLVVPSAHRVSSDSSRSLPALPSDVQIARCMDYTPNGMFLCVGNISPQDKCMIFSTDSPAITVGELKLVDVVRQMEWSANGEDILLRLGHVIYVWNAMPSDAPRRPVIIIHQDADVVKWLRNNESFLSSKKGIMTSFDIYGNPTGVYQIPSTSIVDFVVTNDGDRAICLVSNFASNLSSTTAVSTQKLIVYNLGSKTVEQVAPVGRHAQSIVRSTVSPDLVLVNFSGTTPPQVWRYRQNTDASERRTSATFLSFKRSMSFKAPSGRFSGYGIFGSTDDKMILSLGEDGDMFIFVTDSGQPLRHVHTKASRSVVSERASQVGLEALRRSQPITQCVAWDPDILAFTVCMGFADGSIWQWKIPLDALNEDDPPSFSLMTLAEEESTLIRAGDVEKDVRNVNEDGES